MVESCFSTLAVPLASVPYRISSAVGYVLNLLALIALIIIMLSVSEPGQPLSYTQKFNYQGLYVEMPAHTKVCLRARVCVCVCRVPTR